MTKPPDYEQTCMIVRNIPYQCEDSRYKGRWMTGGVLGKGRIVWVKNFIETEERPISISAYVEDIGIVSIDPHYLVRAI
jgi:hypothetical protein